MKKRINNVKNFPLRVDNKIYDRIELYASQMKISVNTAINWALDEFASQIQDEKEICQHQKISVKGDENICSDCGQDIHEFVSK